MLVVTEQEPLLDKSKSKGFSFLANWRAFLCYSAASELYVLVCLGVFLPLTLNQYAFVNGSISPRHDGPCLLDQPCEVKLLGKWMTTASFSLYAFSISVLLQALVLVSLSTYSNHAGTGKTTLFSAAATGSIATMLFAFLSPDSPFWPVSALLGIIGNVSFGLSAVCLNSYLPMIAKASDTVKDARLVMLDAVTDDEQALALLNYNSALAKMTAHLSAVGVATGYSTGTVGLVLSLFVISKMGNTLWALRLVVSLAGLTWLLLSIPAAILLDNPDIVQDSEQLSILEGWRRLAAVTRDASHLVQTFVFLVAWFFLSDAFATINGTAVLFARTEIHMSSAQVIVLGIIAPCFGVIGAITIPILARAAKATNLRTLTIVCGLAAIVPLYGSLGLVKQIRHNSSVFGSLTTPTELYVLGALLGFIFGGFQTYARSVFSALIPPGQEARFFSLYAITDKSSSFLGPLIVGLTADATGSLRFGFLVILAGILLPIPLLAFVLDAEKGQRDAQEYAKSRQTS